MEKDHCCCQQEAKDKNPLKGACCRDMGASIVDKMKNKPTADKCTAGRVELISSGAETFRMDSTHRLTHAAETSWELYKEILDSIMEGGWNNKRHPWAPDLQDFWKYPMAFGCYAVPSLVMIEPQRFEEASEYLKKAVQLMKDTPVWDDYLRYGFGENPVTEGNVMYKGHLNLMYGLYQLVTGKTDFEEEFRILSDIMAAEYEQNAAKKGFYGILCEPDQWFPQCNSMGLMSFLIRDVIYGTDLKSKYVEPVVTFIRERISDPETGLMYSKYHPSHDHVEHYITGFTNAWALIMMHLYAPEDYEASYEIFKEQFVKEAEGTNTAYLREYPDYDEPSTGLEESMGLFYCMALAKEFRDPDLWEKIFGYFTSVYGIKLQDKRLQMTEAAPEDATFLSMYLFWGNVHQGWQNILDYDWKKVREGRR